MQLALLSTLVLLATSAALANVLPVEDTGLEARNSGTTIKAFSPCAKPLIRKEWRTLSKKEKKSYISAVHCLASKPNVVPKHVVPGAVSLYDSFVATHSIAFPEVHFSGTFLPFHRMYVALIEKTLRKECGYIGAQPYWDWTLDIPPKGNFNKSPLWDPVYGFGGNGAYKDLPSDFTGTIIPGRTGGGCVQNGPFANLTVTLGPHTDLSGNNPRCLTRDFSPLFASLNSKQALIDDVLSRKNFASMSWATDGEAGLPPNGQAPTRSIHSGGHFSVGGSLGTMGDPPVASYEPLFWLHHANLDRVWWSWQVRDLRKRLVDIDGPIVQMDFKNEKGGNVTLSTPLNFGYIGGPFTIRDTMDIRKLCFDYDKYY